MNYYISHLIKDLTKLIILEHVKRKIKHFRANLSLNNTSNSQNELFKKIHSKYSKIKKMYFNHSRILNSNDFHTDLSYFFCLYSAIF